VVRRGYINRNGVGGTGALPPSVVWEPFSEWPTIHPDWLMQARLSLLILLRAELRSGENLGLHRLDTFTSSESSANFR
jgi:hypothetical protein